MDNMGTVLDLFPKEKWPRGIEQSDKWDFCFNVALKRASDKEQSHGKETTS